MITKATIRKYAKCQNCETIQSCEKSKSYTCGSFKLYGGDPGPKPSKSRDMCSGCTNDFYNHGPGAKIAIGGSCMSYKTATVVLKSCPPLTLRPPWRLNWYLSCYRPKHR